MGKREWEICRVCERDIEQTYTYGRGVLGRCRDCGYEYYRIKQDKVKDENYENLKKGLHYEVRRLHTNPEYVISENGDIYRLTRKSFRELKGNTESTGYRSQYISNPPQRNRKGIRGKERLIHRLVAETFLPNPESLPQVNHIDGDKSNNAVGNLEWSSSKDNVAHAYELGLRTVGETLPSTKLTEEKVRKIKDRIADGDMLKDIAKDYNVTSSTISSIKSRVNWSHVKDKSLRLTR